MEKESGAKPDEPSGRAGWVCAPCVCACVYRYVSVRLCVYIDMIYVFARVCIQVHVCIYVCLCIYVHLRISM